MECFKRARPNEKYRFEFTTSSKTIQNRLGKSDRVTYDANGKKISIMLEELNLIIKLQK